MGEETHPPIFALPKRKKANGQQCKKAIKLKDDSVAQLVEQYTFNVWVLGSNPSRITKTKAAHPSGFFCFLAWLFL